MNKKYLYLILLSIIVITFGLYYYNSSSNSQNNIIKDTLIKNIDGSNLIQSESPYVIGNEIELYYILDYSNGSDISVNLSLLEQEFSISSVYIGNRELEFSNIINFIITENSSLKIIGIAKYNNNIGEKSLRDLIQISAKKSKKINIENSVSEKIINLENNSGNINNISDDLDNIQEQGILESNLVEKIEVITENEIEIIPEVIKNNIFSNLKFNYISFNSNINNLLEISGENINKIKFLNIGSYSFIPNIKNNKAYFLINKNTFSTGNYFVFIQPIEGKIIALDTQIYFSYTGSKINIANITPSIVNNTRNTFIVLQGNGFSDIISLQLNNNLILKDTSFEIINDKVLSVKIDKQLNPGTYHFNIMTTDGIINLDNMNFTITQ